MNAQTGLHVLNILQLYFKQVPKIASFQYFCVNQDTFSVSCLWTETNDSCKLLPTRIHMQKDVVDPNNLKCAWHVRIHKI